jgi:alpha-L-rhamnosidase
MTGFGTSGVAGVGRPSDLNDAEWITVAEASAAPAHRPAYEFSTTFSVQSTRSSARLTVTAHGIYEAFLNGRRVGDLELTPGFTSYRSTLQVQSFDVDALLRTGDNHIVLRVSDGWFRGRCGAARTRNNFGDSIAVIAALHMGHGVERRTVLTTGAHWGVAVGSIVAADLMDGQTTDLRVIGATLVTPAVLAVDPLTADRGRLIGQSAPPVRRAAEYPPVSIVRRPDGRQIIDFGTTVNGWVRLTDLGPAETTTVLTYGEWLSTDGDLTLDHLSFVEPDGTVHCVGQQDRVTSRGVSGDEFEPRHTTHGFRYVAVDGRDDDIAVDDIVAVLVRSDLERTGVFRTDHADLRRLHAVVVQSWLANTCDVPTDCPTRERYGYTGDFQIFVRAAAFLDDIDLFSRKWLRSLADDQHANGKIPNVAPNSGDSLGPKYGVDLDGSAGWGDAATFVPWEIYESYGDLDILRDHFDMMRRWVDYIAVTAAAGRHPLRAAQRPEPLPHERYLWDASFHWGEWLEPGAAFDPTQDQAIVSNAYFARSAHIVSNTARLIGRPDDAHHYRQLSNHASDAWRREFLRQDGSLTIETQAAYVRGLAFGLIPEPLRRAAVSRLVELIRAAGTRIGTGFLSTPYLLPVLADHGHGALAYELLFQRDVPGWMVMLDRGATAVWEAWEGVDAHAQATDSLTHYSKGAVISFLHEYVAGLRRAPGSVGGTRFRVAPLLHEAIGSAGADLRTNSGTIRVDWRRVGLDLMLHVGVPDASQAELVLPGMPARQLDAGDHTIRHRLTSDDVIRSP